MKTKSVGVLVLVMCILGLGIGGMLVAGMRSNTSSSAQAEPSSNESSPASAPSKESRITGGQPVAQGMPVNGASVALDAAGRAPSPAKHVEKAPSRALPAFLSQDSDGQLVHLSAIAVNANLAEAEVAWMLEALDDARVELLVKNHIANVLNRQQKIPLAYPELLRRVVDDPASDPAWQDYALQHLGVICEREADPVTSVATIRRAFESNRGSLPGTALLALLRLDENGTASMPEQAHERIGVLLLSPNIADEVRVTVMSLSGERQWMEQRQRLRDLTLGETNPVLIRASVVALGNLGNPDDVSLIHRFVSHPDAGVAEAAHQALAKLHHPVAIHQKLTE